MDSHSSVITSEAGMSDTGAQGFALRQLPAYAMCAALGLLAGALGVALAIGLTILINLLSPASVIFAPGVIPLMAASALVGVTVAWLLGRVATLIWPGLFAAPYEHALHVIMVFSVLASLPQTILFFAPI